MYYLDIEHIEGTSTNLTFESFEALTNYVEQNWNDDCFYWVSDNGMMYIELCETYLLM